MIDLDAMDHDTLCRRAENRIEAARRVVAMAGAIGATVTETRQCPLDRRAWRVSLALEDYRVSLDFDGGLHLGAFLAHWHTASRSAAVYPPDFPAESINRYHWGKATTHAATFGELLAKLEGGLRKLGAGRAILLDTQ